MSRLILICLTLLPLTFARPAFAAPRDAAVKSLQFYPARQSKPPAIDGMAYDMAVKLLAQRGWKGPDLVGDQPCAAPSCVPSPDYLCWAGEGKRLCMQTFKGPKTNDNLAIVTQTEGASKIVRAFRLIPFYCPCTPDTDSGPWKGLYVQTPYPNER